MGSDIADGSQLVWELKSKTFGFSMAKRSLEPEKHDVAQASMYAMAVPDARGIHLVYMCKDSSYGKNATRAGETVEWIMILTSRVPARTA